MNAISSVLHVPFCYFPDTVGGTEVYVQSLCEAQRELGVDPYVSAPSDDKNNYIHDGIPVYRYRIADGISNIEDLYGPGDPNSASEFGSVLDQLQPDVVHFHALTRGVSLLHLREANKRHISTCFTYHTPTVSCVRGTMMWCGNLPCDGAPYISRCSACLLQKHGLPHSIAKLVTLFGGAWGRKLPGTKLSYAVQMPELVASRTDVLKQYLSEVGQIIAVCQWVYDVLVRWGVPQHRLHLVRHGLTTSSSSLKKGNRSGGCGKLIRLAYFGRVDPTKGLDLVLNAFIKARKEGLTLDIFGVVQNREDNYIRKLRTLVNGTAGVNWKPALAGSNEVITTMASYDAVLVPSTGMETGPLVAYEAASVGVPIVGHSLGGLVELVPDTVPGLLLKPTIDSWVIFFQQLDREFLNSLKAGTRVIQSMHTVAREIQKIY